MIIQSPLEVSVVVKGKPGELIDFAASIKPICTLNYIPELSYLLHHFHSFEALSPMDINVFRRGIMPMWEDKENVKGGKYIIRFRKECSQRIFEKILVALVSEEFKSLIINGVVLSLRPKQHILGIWTKVNPTKEEEDKFLKELQHVIGVNFNVVVEFKLNDESIKDNSSFRNAVVHN